MKAFGLFAAFAAVAAAVSVDPIVIKGQHFFYKTNGTQFFIKGIAYQQDVGSNTTSKNGPTAYTDPLADPSGCQRDLPYLVQLQVNTIRVYAVDPTQNHDDCMNMFAAAGIYVISDLSQPDESINRYDPQWNVELYNRYTSVIDMFSKYSNVIGFFAGNEVSNLPNATAASAYVKAAVRDSKAYIAAQGYQNVGVGYATYDGPIRAELANYFACGDASEAIDFWGYNVYSWCGPTATYQTSSYQARTKEFEHYPVPVFFAEYGCNTVYPRFTDVTTLFGPLMTPVWSGGIAYMYFQTSNNFGLVSVSGNTVTKLPSYNQYLSQIQQVDPKPTQASSYTPSGIQTPSCPKVGNSWQAQNSPLPPSPNSDLCSCMAASLDCVVSKGVAQTAYGKLFSYICGNDNSACAGILSNATTGQFGAYSVCDSTQQLGYVMNQYYQSQKQASTACDFSGAASLVQGQSPSGTCASLISQAGDNGSGTVASPVASGTPISQTAGAGDSGSGSGSPSASTSTGAASSIYQPPSSLATFLSMSLYVFGAFLAGAGMLLL